ncbi:30S ribosomal protein S8 [Patescibacteria group bacterium]|nr:30S ribosomal protein S8 [Patescibacteria group bacterium]HOM78380.1 30S ribosomal protein S8 [bacterium]
MSVDTIANMLSIIKNASKVGKPSVEVPYSKQKAEIAKVLESKGFISKVKVFNDKEVSYKGLHLDLAYTEGLPVVTDIKKVSRPGRRVYKNHSELGFSKGGYGVLVVSTSRGIMSGEDARKKKLGGEVICEVW